MPPGRVLIVNDDVRQFEILRQYLDPLPIEIQGADGAAAAIELLATERFDAVLCDLVMPKGSGQAVLRFMQDQGLPTPVIIVTEDGDGAGAEAWLGSGAFDFLTTPVDPHALLAVLRRALLRSGLLCESLALPPPDRPALEFPNLVGKSAAMREVLTRVAKVGEADTNVLLYGESGTGKELIAHAIHYSGPRASRPFVVLDCAAIPEGLMESELFGHVKGAFTSAGRDREGVFQLADGGTLFLDEVGELGLTLQAKLLRVIQSREFRKVGGRDPIRVNVRIIAATNQNLQALVAEGKFREDLLYRLEVIPIIVPPLRHRKDDIPLLVEHFIEQFNRDNRKQIRGLSPGTMAALLRYEWPGNIRELQNCIERAAVMAEGQLLEVTDLAQDLRPTRNTLPLSPAEPDPWPRRLQDAERDLILQTLEAVQGNRARAAQLLGISLRALYYKLKEWKGEGSLLHSGQGVGVGQGNGGRERLRA